MATRKLPLQPSATRGKGPGGALEAEGVVEQVKDHESRIATLEESAAWPKWRDVATEISFENGWVNYGGAYADAGFLKTDDGWVYLKGMVKSGTVALAIFHLPTGFIPPSRKIFATISNGAIGIIEVLTDGGVFLSVGSNVYASLDGVYFRVT